LAQKTARGAYNKTLQVSPFCRRTAMPIYNNPSSSAALNLISAGLTNDLSGRVLGDGRNAFLSWLSQPTRLVQIETALQSTALVVERLRGHEGVSQLFQFDVDCLSSSSRLELKTVLGEEMTLKLLLADGTHRCWHGYVTEAAALGADGGLARYRLTLRPWLAFLGQRRDCYAFQDATLPEILSDIFADYAPAHFRFDLTRPLRPRSLCVQYNETDLAFVQRLLAEEGLSWRFEHEQSNTAQDNDSVGSDKPAHARHCLVIFDLGSALPEGTQASIRFHRSDATETSDSITSFTRRTQVRAGQVSVASWDYKTLRSPAGQAQATHYHQILGAGVPLLETTYLAGAYHYTDHTHAEQVAQFVMHAHALPVLQHHGSSSVRTLTEGTLFSLTQHDEYPEGQNRLVVLSVMHEATNNLGAQAAELLANTDLEAGTYRNHFVTVPRADQDNGVPLVVSPLHADRFRPDHVWGHTHTTPLVGPAARARHARLQTALVVGVPTEPLTTERDHRIKVQFHWQRGIRPNAGGLGHDERSAQPEGNAPGDETSGTWVRVAQTLAGPNWGSVFVPRIGTEVVVDFIDGDPSRPVVIGQTYNGQDLPPWSAGQNSCANHPGVLKGWHTQSLDSTERQQYLSDTTPGQLRTQLATSVAASQLNLGHLVHNGLGQASRGAYRGSGAELRTDAWAVLRAGEGLLIASTARAPLGSGISGCQLDSQEAQGQLTAALNTAQRLHVRATQASGLGLAANAELEQLARDLDRASGDQPFAQPHLVLDSPQDIAHTTPASVVSFSSASTHRTVQGSTFDTAGATASYVSGGATSVVALQGGIGLVAAHGAISLQAHTDQLAWLSKESLSLTSVNGVIEISAPNHITLQAGDSGIELNGANVTLKTPGTVDWKAAAKNTGGALSGGTNLPVLPVGRVGEIKLENESPLANTSEKFSEQVALINPITGDASTVHAKLLKDGVVQQQEKVNYSALLARTTVKTEQETLLGLAGPAGATWTVSYDDAIAAPSPIDVDQ
jgi:type VI secretion system secreted protein VgrG